jgi:hypothetical protein
MIFLCKKSIVGGIADSGQLLLSIASQAGQPIQTFFSSQKYQFKQSGNHQLQLKFTILLCPQLEYPSVAALQSTLPH